MSRVVDLKEIWFKKNSTEEVILKTRIESLSVFNCYLGTNSKTGDCQFIFELSKETSIPEFKNLIFKGVLIQPLEYQNTNELVIYLLDIQLIDIFTLFIENIIEEISDCSTEREALNKVNTVIFKWKKLFDKVNFTGLSEEVQKGLMGELLFMKTLISEIYPIQELLKSWTGPDYEARDFLFGGVGFEIKFTSAKKATLSISSERQLDNNNLSQLFVVLYSAEKVNSDGFSINSLIDEIRSSMKNNHFELDDFNQRLIMIGYFDIDKENYKHQFKIKKRFIYSVDKDFPKIISSDLKTGVFNTTYSIDLSSIEIFKNNTDTISKLLPLWKED